MAYATRADLEARYGVDEIADLAPAGADSDRAAVALADASAEIDGWLAGGYVLPLPAGTYPSLVRICCAVARRDLYDEAPTDAVRDAARRAREELKRIGEDRTAVVDSAGGPPRSCPARRRRRRGRR